MCPTRSGVLRFAMLCIATGKIFASGRIPEQDLRNTFVPDMDTHFEMPVFTSREAWIAKAAFLRKQILSSAGLLPLPEKTPLHAQVFGKIERGTYSVEKVLLETYPGFYLGGNLYRPMGKTGPFPGIVTPHGHWKNGRLENTAQVSVPGRCINLARMGMVVFSYDMVGYNDTDQFPHGDRGARLGGPREDLWSINTMGLQLWDSMRAVDFVSSLPEVDPKRIGMTGASGGGTQTFLLTAVDERITASAPVNMISAYMQGNGCEEAPNLRVGAFNVMFGAMTAPRPLLMISATGDWTSHTPKEEYPAVQGIYRLLGVERNVESVQIDQKHNYSKESREAMYSFFNARLLGGHGPVAEQPYQVEQMEDLLVRSGKERPANAVTMERFVADRIEDAERGIKALFPRDRASLRKSRAAFLERLTFSLLDTRPAPDEVLSEIKETLPQGEVLLLARAGKGDRVPAVWLAPVKENPDIRPTLIVHSDGVAWVRSSAQKSGTLVSGILERGGCVMGIDAFQTGSAKEPRDRDTLAFTVFNQTDDANRVQDILTAIVYLQERSRSRRVNLVGLETGGIWTTFARALAGPGVNLAADLKQFRATVDQEYLDRFFVPGLRKAGDFRAAAVLDTQGSLLLHNAGSDFPADWVKQSGKIGASSAQVRTSRATEEELLAWLVSLPARR